MVPWLASKTYYFTHTYNAYRHTMHTHVWHIRKQQIIERCAAMCPTGIETKRPARYAWTITGSNIDTHTHARACSYTHTYNCTYIRKQTYVCIHTWQHMHMHQPLIPGIATPRAHVAGTAALHQQHTLSTVMVIVMVTMRCRLVFLQNGRLKL